MNIAKTFLMVCALGGPLLVTGCSNPDDDPLRGLTVQQARSQVIDSVSGTSSQLYGNMTAVMDDSDVPANASTRALARSIVLFADTDINYDEEQEFKESIAAILDILLDEAEQQGDTITYKPNGEVLCHDADGVWGRIYCELLLTHISLVQTVETDQSGTLGLYFDDLNALTLGYAPDSFYLELDLAESKSALLAFARFVGEDELNDELPYTFEGITRLSVAKDGEQAGELLWSIPQPLQIAGYVNEDQDQGFYDFLIEATAVALRIKANEIAETAEIELGLGGVDIELTDLSQNEPVHFEAALSQLTGELAFDGASESAEIRNLGLGSAPLEITLNKSKIIDLLVPQFNVSVDGTDNTLSFNDSRFSVELEVALNDIADLIFGTEVPDMPSVLNGQMTLDVPQYSVLTVYEQPDSDNDILQVTAGSVSGTGSGLFSAGAPFEAEPGDCFTGYEDESDDPAFPFVMVGCPE